MTMGLRRGQEKLMLKEDLLDPGPFSKQMILLPTALFKSILRIFDCCTMILQLLGKRATKKAVDRSHDKWRHKTSNVSPSMTSISYCWQCFCDLKQLGNKTVISRLFGEQSNYCPLEVEKIWETVALGIQPLATVSKIFSTTSGQ